MNRECFKCNPAAYTQLMADDDDEIGGPMCIEHALRALADDRKSRALDARLAELKAEAAARKATK